ncbi:MAG: cysteine desulfurase family protein [Rhodoluna sp.]|nr:cysteine desulfurase family protein [Rhodoluna sp.]
MGIYLDHAATTAIYPVVVERLAEDLLKLGNPSSIHTAGQTARAMLESAREDLARVVGCDRQEVIFTSGGTESDNLAIKGLYWAATIENPERNIIVSAYTEHHAVIDPIEWLETYQGAKVHWLKVDEQGLVDFDELAVFLDYNKGKVALISLMWSNNETGVLTDLRRVVDLARTHSIPVHTDAVAAFGHTDVNFFPGLTAMSLSAHKVGGPVGVGALIVARDAKLTSIQQGGGQERDLRGGTMNAAGARAFASAARMSKTKLATEGWARHDLLNHLTNGVARAVPGARFSRGSAPGVPDLAHFTFPGCSGDSMLYLFDQHNIEVSTGSACTAGVARASHVLLTMGRSQEEATGTLRISIGRDTTKDEIDEFLRVLPEVHKAALKAGLTA